MHVVERYTISPDGQDLKAEFYVEDPGMFATAWSSHVVRFRGVASPWAYGT